MHQQMPCKSKAQILARNVNARATVTSCNRATKRLPSWLRLWTKRFKRPHLQRKPSLARVRPEHGPQNGPGTHEQGSPSAKASKRQKAAARRSQAAQQRTENGAEKGVSESGEETFGRAFGRATDQGHGKGWGSTKTRPQTTSSGASPRLPRGRRIVILRNDIQHLFHIHRYVTVCNITSVMMRSGISSCAEDLQRHAAKLLPRHMVPADVFVWGTALPRGATGKIQKRDIREQMRRAKL